MAHTASPPAEDVPPVASTSADFPALQRDASRERGRGFAWATRGAIAVSVVHAVAAARAFNPRSAAAEPIAREH
jgi:hypothetical protein